jgi:ribosomal protein S18 acetylase RimI-like enzyme
LKKDIYISRDKEDMNIKQLVNLLHTSDWAAKREEELIIKTVENSFCYGVLDKDKNLIGFARIITDFATAFYLMDVIIEEASRGMGYGKMLLDEIMKDVGHLYGVLHTDSARGLYEAYGFRVTATSATGEYTMEKQRR